MSEREYIVTLKKGVDYNAFNAEMIAATGGGAIPNRSATVANARPGSQRNTHYMLTDEEATALNSDSRVVACELRPDLRDDIEIGLHAVQTGVFAKSTETRGDNINWGLRRVNEANNPYIGYTISGGYNYTLDGTGVDIVIQDSGLQVDHPEFQDADGNSRVQQIDWYAASGLPGTQSANHYRDYDGHGTHCAGIAAGKTYGWAKNANIYSVKVAGLEGTGDSGTGIPISDVFDVIKEWHNAKPIDPLTGAKRPTIVNMSWGYGSYFYDVDSITYRGATTASPDNTGQYRDTAKGMIGSYYSLTFGYRFGIHVASVDADVEELIDAGVHVCIAGGNYRQKIDIDGGDDYDNYFTRSAASFYFTPSQNVYYNRGSSPFSTEAFIVGNIDSDIAANGREQAAESSEKGPGVNVWAPGTNIFSTLSTTNSYDDGPYQFNGDYLIGNLSGTSMASPQVAGVLALWLQLNPGSTPAQALNYFTGAAKTDRLYTTGFDNDYTNARSLLGSNNRFIWNKFNSKTQLSIGSTLTEAQTDTSVIKTYALTASSGSVDEGNTVTITLTTTNIAQDSTVDYVITGVSSADINGDLLEGSFTIGDDGIGTKTFTFALDVTTEGAETMVLELVGIDKSVSVVVNDTST